MSTDLCHTAARLLPVGEPFSLVRTLTGEFAPRDVQHLMAYPFFSLAKSRRVAPIDFADDKVSIRVAAEPGQGIATIWDADILIWAASQVVEARDAGLRTSPRMLATPYSLLKFIGRGTGARDYQRLKAALDRLQSTIVYTSIRQRSDAPGHRFTWIAGWKERRDRDGKADGIELLLPDWFYQTVLNDALVLTIDRRYFQLTGGLDRWLYRHVRKHGGRQRHGWRFDFRHLHQKSGALSPFKRFAFELRDSVRRQPLPGYTLFVEVDAGGRTLLAFEPSCGKLGDRPVRSGTRRCVPPGTGGACDQELKPGLTNCKPSAIGDPNLESNRESNSQPALKDAHEPVVFRGGDDTWPA